MLGKTFWTVSWDQVGLGGPSYVPVEVGAGVWRQQRWGPPPGGRVHCPACSLLHDTNWSAGGGAGAGQRGWTSIHRPRVEGQGRGSCVTSGQAWHPINNCDAVTRGSCRQASRLTGSQHGSGLPPVWVEWCAGFLVEGNRGHMRGRYVLIWAHSDVAGQRGHVANRFGLRWPHREKWGDWGCEARVRAVACGLFTS